jgi:aspartyl aminopeptidase
MSRFIDRNSTGFHHISRITAKRSSQDCIHSRHKDLWTERLGNIFIYAKIKSLQFISFF